MTVQSATQVHAGEPFQYRVRILYRPEKVAPDFTGLLRNVRFVPFEQLHLSRPAISNTTLADGTHEYILSYPVVGISIVPHIRYPLDPVRLTWRVSATGETGETVAQPEPVQIIAYYPADISGQQFQPLRPAINDYYLYKQLGILALALLFLVPGARFVHAASRRRDLHMPAQADFIRQQYESIAATAQDTRQSLLSYEKIVLTLLLYYRKYTAHDFWTRDPQNGAPDWKQVLQTLKQGFRPAYQIGVPDAADVSAVKNTVQDVFNSIEMDISKERAARLDELQGTWSRRIHQHKFAFVSGALAIVCGLVLALLLLWPSIWRENDTVVFNEWINELPDRVFDSSRDTELGVIDVQMLVQLAEQKEVLQHIKQDSIKSDYLYNFGTLVARAYVSILSTAEQAEEEFAENETTNKPSFEFPLQLIANAVRFYPYTEYSQSNLELVIMLRQSEKKDEESGKVQGEIGPPLPGFSRDLNPLLF